MGHATVSEQPELPSFSFPKLPTCTWTREGICFALPRFCWLQQRSPQSECSQPFVLLYKVVFPTAEELLPCLRKGNPKWQNSQFQTENWAPQLRHCLESSHNFLVTFTHIFKKSYTDLKFLNLKFLNHLGLGFTTLLHIHSKIIKTAMEITTKHQFYKIPNTVFLAMWFKNHAYHREEILLN